MMHVWCKCGDCISSLWRVIVRTRSVNGRTDRRRQQQYPFGLKTKTLRITSICRQSLWLVSLVCFLCAIDFKLRHTLSFIIGKIWLWLYILKYEFYSLILGAQFAVIVIVQLFCQYYAWRRTQLRSVKGLIVDICHFYCLGLGRFKSDPLAALTFRAQLRSERKSSTRVRFESD